MASNIKSLPFAIVASARSSALVSLNRALMYVGMVTMPTGLAQYVLCRLLARMKHSCCGTDVCTRTIKDVTHLFYADGSRIWGLTKWRRSKDFHMHIILYYDPGGTSKEISQDKFLLPKRHSFRIPHDQGSHPLVLHWSTNPMMMSSTSPRQRNARNSGHLLIPQPKRHYHIKFLSTSHKVKLV